MQNPKLQGSLSVQFSFWTAITISIIASLTVISGSLFAAIKLRDATQNVIPTVDILPEIKTVTALGKISPQGEIIKLSAGVSGEGNRVEKLLVKEGDRVKVGQIIAVLNNCDRLQAALKEAQEDVKVAQANLTRIQAGAKSGEIAAQKATIAALTADNQGDINTQTANVERLQAEVLNAETEDKRYQLLYQEGAISASQRDSKRLILETTKKQLQAAQAELNRSKLTSKEKLKEATSK